jgi:multidrug efflux pump subunit AcrB
VIDRVKQKIKEIEPGPAPGVHIVPFYDRSQLIEATVDTLRHALIEEIILVTLAHVIFLMHFRSIFVVTVPFAACRALLLPADALCACDFECNVACGASPSLLGCWWMQALSSLKMCSDI